MTITARGAQTRRRIVEGAAAEIRETGVAATLDEIRARTHTSKGQIFHYFPGGKDELLLAVAQFEAERVITEQQPFLDALHDERSWWAWRDALVERYRAQGADCPLAAVNAELGRSSPGARAVTAALLREWESRLLHGIGRARAADLVVASATDEQLAGSIITATQGGALLLVTTGSERYLENALDATLERMLGGR